MRARLLAMSLLMMAATSPAAADTLQEAATHGPEGPATVKIK